MASTTHGNGKSIISFIPSNYGEKLTEHDISQQRNQILNDQDESFAGEMVMSVVVTGNDTNDTFIESLDTSIQNIMKSENNDSHNSIVDINPSSTVSNTNCCGLNINMLILIYSGRKYFWRTKSNLHVHVIEHCNCNCIEFIAYDTDLKQEAPRIYLNASQVYETIEEQRYEQQVEDIKKELSKNISVDIPEEIMLRNAVRRNMMAQKLIENMSVQVRPFLVNILSFSDNAVPMTSILSRAKSTNKN